MSTQSPPSGIPLSHGEFTLFQRLIHERTGVVLTERNQKLVVARLSRRLRALGLTSFASYYRQVLEDPEEYQLMIDLLTTHETHFFREPHHFTFLREVILAHHPPKAPYTVWCAACATGEEAWSVAMVLAERLGESSFWSVLASDVSISALAKAQAGCYPRERLRSLPLLYRDLYCRCIVVDGTSQWVIAPELRQRVTFLPINLTDTLPEIGPFDLILLRNIMIYFDHPTKQRVTNQCLSKLRVGGHLFVGHAERLTGFSHSVKLVRPTIYRRVC